MSGPFAGLLVVDLTRVLAGPYVTMILADMGATVVKVEQPGAGDDARGFPPFINGKSAYFTSLNRGKKSIALDLKAPKDRAVFERLLARADVLIENYRGGAMEKLGFGWETLGEKFPRLIYAAVSGFGHTGPYRARPAYDMVVQAMGGVMSLTGHAGGPPTRVGTSIGDITAGLFATVGIVTALYERTRTGRGQKVDIAMLDAQVAILENAFARYAATGVVPGPMGSRHPSIAPFGAVKAKDGHIVIAAGNDTLFAKLCEALNAPAMANDPRFRTNTDRTANIDTLYAELDRLMADATAGEWLARFEVAGVPCGPINDIAGVLADPQVSARNMIVTAEDAVIGKMRMPGNPVKMSAHADAPSRPGAPELDGDREEILALIRES